jgi:hypothetical protein
MNIERDRGRWITLAIATFLFALTFIAGNCHGQNIQIALDSGWVYVNNNAAHVRINGVRKTYQVLSFGRWKNVLFISLAHYGWIIISHDTVSIEDENYKWKRYKIRKL